MKRTVFSFLLLMLNFALCGIFSETHKKTIVIDNLYRIEQTYDDSMATLELRLISDNSAPFDEQYADDCISEALDDFQNDYSLDCVQTESSVNYDGDNGKSTLLSRKYSVK